jgi:hypothetical protein
MIGASLQCLQYQLSAVQLTVEMFSFGDLWIVFLMCRETILVECSMMKLDTELDYNCDMLGVIKMPLEITVIVLGTAE